jgi:hypothetical protein
LLKIGEGHVNPESDLGENVICLPEDLIMKSDELEELICVIYGNNLTAFFDVEFVKERAILATTNRDVDDINATVMRSLLGEVNFAFTN